MKWKLYFKKIVVFILSFAVLHSIFLLSVIFSYQYTKYLINVDVLLLILIFAYIHLAYTLFINKNLHQPNKRKDSQ